MKLIQILCCNALINPFYPMVEVHSTQYPLSIRLLRALSCLLAGGIIAQPLTTMVAFLLMEDSQAAGMVGHLVIQQLSYYFLGCTFLILSLANILIKRGIHLLKPIRLPALILMLSISTASFLLIPRMDYLRETALQDGMPVMLSPFANYFAILSGLTWILLCVQITSSLIVAWRLSTIQST